MVTDATLYLGIDLGTTNSAAAMFDGSQLSVIRNAQGGALTPSVVRIDARGNVLVGERARRHLETDPDNTRSEFKRLMGSSHRLEFKASASKRTPVELSAEVLRALRKDVTAQLGFEPARAVVSVPALFELPQTSATSEAARLAGFERIELIQEPVASAIAAGWSNDESGAWLVYDLGGGTFDASLLSTQEGLLRVVGHDGDNFLGGRDLDAALVAHMIERLSADGVQIDRANPSHAGALRRLRLAAEEAKIELSRERTTSVDFSFILESAEHSASFELTRAEAEQRMLPLIDRSIEVCRRLLERHGVRLEDLTRVVLVGGPTVIPLLRQRVQAALRAPFDEGLDPMTLVAQGAALFAATAALDARPKRTAPVAPSVPRVWLQFPAVTSDPTPYVLGKLLEPNGPVRALRVARANGSWQSESFSVDAEGTFATMVSLEPRKTTEFRLWGLAADGKELTVEPSSISIAHGLTLGEPPLSRSIGVALANDSVQVYLERGAPLPTRRTFSHRSADNVSPAAPGFALRIPIVQGEFEVAHLCRLVGVLEIASSALKGPLPAGSTVEVTLHIDRGGRLQASARIPKLDQMFEDVAQLVVPDLSLEALDKALGDVTARVQTLRASALRRGSPRLVNALARADVELPQLRTDVAFAHGGDPDAGQQAARVLTDFDAWLWELESGEAWPELTADAHHQCGLALSWLSAHGSPEERQAYTRAAEAIERALTAKNAGEIKRQLTIVQRLGDAAYLREPGAWEAQLSYLESRVTDTTDPVAARRALERGNKAVEQGNSRAVEAAVREVWQLLHEDRDERRLSYESGVR
jgi:molecular chaperone DnaK